MAKLTGGRIEPAGEAHIRGVYQQVAVARLELLFDAYNGNQLYCLWRRSPQIWRVQLPMGPKRLRQGENRIFAHKASRTCWNESQVTCWKCNHLYLALA